jgi:thiol-disulfide isomerase/thioredoxin
MKRILPLIIIIIAFAGCFGSEPQKTGKEGKRLPEFNIFLTDNTWLNIATFTVDKPIIIFYFNPYCPFCKAQTEEIIDDMARLKSFQFYFISDYPLLDIINFSNKYNLAKYSNITIGLDSTSKVKDYYEISAVPYLAIYKKDKTLNKSFLGKTYSSQLIKAIK